jgi:hypothetical protein
MKSKFDHLIGKPFGEYGRGPDFYDCWGVVIESGKIMGLDTPDYKSLSHRSHEEIWSEVSIRIPEYEKIDRPVIGSIILFKNIDGNAHFGRVIGGNCFIHSTEELGVHVSSIDGFYSRLIKGFYSCKE